ncbi:hypothetical protein ACJ41O_004955 [Fusarium nematophilum]
MASASNASGLDHVITVKVLFEGVTRRTKMPLRDMVPRTLESNIRTFLHIPADAEVTFERYSDSAASYVLLELGNIPIYKQLYRAAKAKSKLKIRVTVKEAQPKTVPKPVTVEDEPEASASAPAPKTSEESPKETPQANQDEASPVPTPTAEAPAPTPASSVSPPETALPFRTSPLSRTYNAALLSDAARYIGERQEARRDFENRLAHLMERQSLPTQVPRSCTYRVPKPPQHPFTVSKPCALPAYQCPAICPAAGATFAVCCNSCERTIPDVHYHCSSCDDGDFDLCQSCIDQGISCHGKDHWLIKRTTVNGQLVQSTTETIAPKPKPKPKPKAEVKVETTIETKVEPKIETKIEPKVKPKVQPKIEAKDEAPLLPHPLFEPLAARWASLGIMRTCNCCVQELPEAEFLHCTSCEDFDLCQPCFAKDAHGHHPKHGFVPAVKGTKMPDHVTAKMNPGRNQMHHAICDGCDKYITGVRHKCLDCPDWDYCVSCIKSVRITHPGHRFVPIYEQLTDVRVRSPPPVHIGICCDGPLCSGEEAYPNYIRGVRYKCAICNDLDFCANCEASPINAHNKTHPLIKFKTPVRHVSISTTGEHQGGQRMRLMGDHHATAAATETVSARSNSINAVRTIVDVKPTEPVPAKVSPPEVEAKKEEPKPEVKEEKKALPAPIPSPKEELKGVFVRDTVQDGTILPPNHVFEQTWTLRNEGKETWPAGCSVRFVGGDYMGHVDSNHPAGISELVSASESTVCYAPLAPGQEFPFTVLLRTPARAGKVISYWRLTTPDGEKFGHRLWCDVNVRMVKAEPEPAPEAEAEAEANQPIPAEEPKKEDDSQASSQMIFPKLEKESPVASIHEAVEPAPTVEESVESKDSDTVEEDWEYSDDGFMTDEEYDILDASDEEYLEEQKKKLASK